MVKRLSLAALCALPLLVALPNRLGAQSGTIRGRVADAQGAPLPRAAVSVDAIGARTTTDDQGSYEIRGVPTGTHTVRVRLLGYVPQSVQVTVSGRNRPVRTSRLWSSRSRFRP